MHLLRNISRERENGGETMLKKKQVLVVAGVACVMVTSLAVVADAGWSPYWLANWMGNIGRYYITNTYSTVYYNIKPKLDSFYEWVKDEVDRETVEIEILTLEFDTILGFYPPLPSKFYSTKIGGPDIFSDVYVVVTMRGVRYHPYYINATVMDGDSYGWEVEVFELDNGWHDVFVTAPYGVKAGSYMVEVEARVSSLGESYYGKGYYIIDCTATTIEIE